MKMLVLSAMVLTVLAIGGCASSEDDEGGRPAQGGDESKSEKVSSAMIEEFAVAESLEAAGHHDGRCTGGEILLGCRTQACTYGSGLPNPQCPLGYYCWCY